MFRMLAFALLPLVCYCAFLTMLHFRQTPTVLNGAHDFFLLAWGVFGLITLGPGRLIIPLYVFTAWGLFTWFFWLGFYYVITIVLARKFRNRMVVYHGRRELVLPAFYTLAQQIDPKTEWSGFVLSLHGLGLQWSVAHDRFGGHLLFIPTNPSLVNPHSVMLQEQLATLCRTLVMPKSPLRWMWGGLTCLLLGLVLTQLFMEYSLLLQQFCDYWL